MVHNGTIANDKEIGAKEGEVDSMALARHLDRSSLLGLVKSLEEVKGSYAIACHNGETVYLACNYKPIHYWSPTPGTVYFSSMERHFDGLLPFGVRPCQLTPYSVLDLKSGESRTIPRTLSKKAVVVCSGGLDSTMVATKLVKEGYEVRLIHFVYGCHAEKKEVAAIERIGKRLGCQTVYLSVPYGLMDGGSPILRDGSPISGGVAGAEYAYEWVPARNLVFISLAIAYAEANGFHYVALGNNLEEGGAYPDNEEQMTVLLDRVADYAVQNGYEVRIISPVGNLMKHEIVKVGTDLGTPWELTWSCYKGGEKACGKCGPDFMRRMAFKRNGMIDPIQYEE
jgi:7-cyano-7-deazaguanine synthase